MTKTLGTAPYVNLETFKKDGTGVKTPVWVGTVDGKLVVGTDSSTFKVKRVQNNPKVRVAVCNASGKKILGPWIDGTARVLRGSAAAPAEEALDRKYGWQRKGFRFFAKLTGRMKDPVIIEITVDKSAG
jgi:PPOX class probable F420-dependent enzyme